MPTLVVCGDEDRDNGSAKELTELLPNAAYAEVPGTHMSSVTSRTSAKRLHVADEPLD